MAEKLDQYLQQGLTVVVCEPSCASALTDDLPDLLEDSGLAQRLEKQVMMIDKFLEKALQEGELPDVVASKFQDVLIHGHCHQKALYGTAGMKSILAKTGAKVQEIDSGCCGMAGSFGYEKEHYALSRKIGESILFPAVKASEPDTAIVACGFSCRHQIEHFTGKKAKHWVEVFEVKDLF